MNATDAFVVIAMLGLVALGAVGLLIWEQRRADDAEVRAAMLIKRMSVLHGRLEEAEMWADEYQRQAFQMQVELHELRALNAEKTRLLLAKNYYVIEQHVRRRQQR